MKRTRPRYVEPMTVEALDALHTGTLLTRLQKLRSLPENRSFSDYSDEEIGSHSDMILFKESDAWRTAMAELKSVLAGREHVKRGGKEARQAAAHAKKHR